MARLALATFALAAAAVAQEPGARGANLLDNPGGETSVAIRVGKSQGVAMFDVPGWESVDGDWVAQAAPWSKVAARSGGTFLRPRKGDLAVLAQTVDLAPAGAPRPRFLIAGAWQRTLQGKDATSLRVVLHDAAHADLAERGTDPARDVAWTWRETFVAVPAVAVRATLELRGIRADGDFADAFFDDAVLEPVGPGLPVGLAGLSVKELTARLDAATDPAERRALLRALVVDPRGVKVVAERQARATDPAERRHALLLLALCAGRAAAAPLEAMLGAADPDDRALALELLAVADVDAAKVLAPLTESRDAKVRAAALRALAALGGGKDGVRVLAKVARDDPDAAIEVMRAIRAAKVDPDPFYRPVLAPWLGADEVAGPRNEAMRTLGELGDRRFLRHLPQLAEAAGSQAVLAEWLRLAARFGDAEAIAAIFGLVDADVPLVDRALLEVAGELRAPAAAEWARRTGLRHDDPLLRLAAVRLLRAAGDGSDVEALRRATADGDPLVALEAVDALGARTGADAGASLGELLRRAPGPVAAAALRELCRREGGAAAAVDRAIAALVGHPAWEVRAAALDLLRAARAPTAFGAVTAAFTDPVWQVRASAYRAAAALREKRAVAALVARAPAERGAALGYLTDALVSLTLVDHGDDGDAWARWWGLVAADFTVPAAPKEIARERGRTTTSYYGIPIRSDNLVFVIDLSGSMAAEVGDRTKLRAAQDELIAVLRSLRPTQRFGILAFGTEVSRYEEALVDASPQNVAAAARWVDRLTIRGATNIYDSLELALAFEGVESVFLLSDGGPSAGKFVDMDEIRRAVRLQNRERLVRLNTILIGGSAKEQDFMRKLAAENHGEVGSPDGTTR